ncbi:DNA-binding response regulator [Burkholderia sp. SRS-W-2-2016]|uniref:response regulator transcription factor n=1 Tax=Burkholderia sp. SRS-W-2-2016 TaxID=1926878 RepID=UPI00094AAEB6|nr:response regulator transcription factor [Burkholderia sp. SRS-W-2-2016]OLL33340.1 DNA-binding response regulator [Burkholderia sp. SRS-W-2-2016]
MRKLHVVVADRHDCIRAGIRYLLRDEPHLDIVGEASSLSALAGLLESGRCDVVVSDLEIANLAQFDDDSRAPPVLRRLLRGDARPRVVVLTLSTREQMWAGLRNLGVSGIVDKRDAPPALLAAIDAVAAGRQHRSAWVQAALDTGASALSPHDGSMSAREWEVFQLYAQGLPVREIAARLQRSGKTISTHKRTAMRKLGLETEADLTRYARQIGLI